MSPLRQKLPLETTAEEDECTTDRHNAPRPSVCPLTPPQVEEDDCTTDRHNAPRPSVCPLTPPQAEEDDCTTDRHNAPRPSVCPLTPPQVGGAGAELLLAGHAGHVTPVSRRRARSNQKQGAPPSLPPLLLLPINGPCYRGQRSPL
ncbi:unnamed protein product [Boreogadus saida]